MAFATPFFVSFEQIFALLMQKPAYILDMIRVPTGKKNGYYKQILPESLVAHLLNKLIERNSLHSKDIELILGNSIGTMGNMTRYAALLSSLDIEVNSSTIDMQCGGSYQSLRIARALVTSGECDAVIFGGLESNSLAPERRYMPLDPRNRGEKHIKVADFSPYPSHSLLLAAENLGLKYSILKEDLFNWTLRSHEKAFMFSKTEAYKNYVSDSLSLNRIDESIRPELSLDVLKRSASNHFTDRTNTAHYHDGVALGILVNEDYLSKYNIKPMAKVLQAFSRGIDPNNAPEGAIIAAKEILIRTEFQVKDIDLFEVNESFGVKPLAFISEFGVDKEKVNVLGGNLAYGHPYAASGAMNLMHLILGLKQNNKKFGLLTAGVAGGFGMGVLIENIN